MQNFWKPFLVVGTLVILAHCQETEEGVEGMDQDSLSTAQLQGLHGKIDQNGDGKISMAETLGYSHDMRKKIAIQDISSVLEEMDSNKDGKLSLEELLKDMEQWGEGEEDKKDLELRKATEAAKFKLADANGDGLLDLQEIPAVFYPETHNGVLKVVTEATLKQKDLNGDGKLTPQEFWEGDVADPGGESIDITSEEHYDFRALDKNSDGFLDLEELTLWESGFYHTEEALKNMFELADKDHDMHLTAAELDAAREKIAGSDAQYHLMEWAEHHEL